MGTLGRHAQRMLALLGLTLGPLLAQAGSLHVFVTSGGKPVTDAVVSLHSAAATAAVKPKPARMDQVNRQFVPHVIVVQVGSEVYFPNSDNVRHDVYSFSPAKRFELPLYGGHSAAPVNFDKPGVVVLGCNIHDWMLGFIVVVDTPYYGMTGGNGQVTVTAPAGNYWMQVWHADLAAGSPPVERDVMMGDGPSSQSVALTLVPRLAPTRPSDAKLRAVQEKFRKPQGG